MKWKTKWRRFMGVGRWLARSETCKSMTGIRGFSQRWLRKREAQVTMELIVKVPEVDKASGKVLYSKTNRIKLGECNRCRRHTKNG